MSDINYLTLEVDELLTVLNSLKGMGLKIQFNNALKHDIHPPVIIGLTTEHGKLEAKIDVDKSYS